jgi:hypothetical protein
MKRILLTTTSLVLAAGVAQADVSFSGKAGIALIDDNGASVYVAPVTGVQGANGAADIAPVTEVERSTCSEPLCRLLVDRPLDGLRYCGSFPRSPTPS